MKIIVPTNCPSCESPLVWKNDQLFCLNADCSSRAFKRIQHFAQTLKIKGLGPAAIQKLDIQDISDIYSMSTEQIVEGLQSEKLGMKLIEEIEKSKSVSLDLLLPAFSIPLIGKTAAEKLCKVINHISELTSETCDKAGIGPKATENLLTWYFEEFVGILDSLPFTFSAEYTESKPTKGIVCITGKLKSFKTKAEAEAFLLDLGYIIKSSITKEVTILVNESGVESAKTQKARDNGVSIITNLLELQ